MSKSKGKHLSKENREVIEVGIREGKSARLIAKRIDVSPSTVTREVQANRVVREIKSPPSAKLSVRCAKYRECEAIGVACKKCSTRLTACKTCRTRSCIDTCSDFVRKMCPTTEKWPYICASHCTKRAHCGYPKCSYSATDAHRIYRTRLVGSRQGINLTSKQLEDMNNIVGPLVRQGQSFEAIWGTHGGELPVSVRSAYNYQEKGILVTANLELPRKVRLKPRKPKKDKDREHTRIIRTGRTYDDFKALALEDQACVVQGDSVEGFQENSQDILSLHLVARMFQFYLLKKHADASAVVAWFDIMEQALGSRERFEAIFGIMLLDRGVEFDDWEGMERSYLEPGHSRCRVFYCDALQSNQKSQAERNHEQLRRILPKGRSDFDKLDVFDVAVCASHVNSYPNARYANMCPFDLIAGLIPQGLLDELGIDRVAPDDVILKPYLMEHAVAQ